MAGLAAKAKKIQIHRLKINGRGKGWGEKKR